MHPLTRRLIERTPRRMRKPVALVFRTVDRAIDDRLPGLAAEIAFWTLLSLPALLLTGLAAVTLVAADGAARQTELVDRLVEVASIALTTDAIDAAVRPALDRLLEGSTISVVSVAFLATVWTASRAVKVVLTTIAITYGADPPPGIAQRLLGLLLTIVGLLVGLVLAPLLVAGPNFGERLGELGVVDGEVVAAAWRAIYYPGAVVVITALLASLYHLGAPWPTRWRRDLPGAVLATGLWLAGSAALRVYGVWILGSEGIYGPLAGPIVALLWLWLTGFAVLLGAELNAQIEHLWPTRAPGDDDDRSRLQRLAASTTGRLTLDRSPDPPEDDQAASDGPEPMEQPQPRPPAPTSPRPPATGS